MNKITTIIFSLLTAVTILFSFPVEISAQGTCSCDLGSGQNPVCNVTSDSCGSNYTAFCQVSSQTGYSVCNCNCKPNTGTAAVTSICSGIADDAQRGECESCGDNGVYTALGCINTNTDGFIKTILGLAVGIGGGVTFIMIVWGAFQYVISAGDPKTLENAKGTISSAIIGLLLIIFSVVILNLIGYEILRLPEF